MKLTMKLFLIISLFCSTAFAGDMPAGGLANGSDSNKECVKCVIDDQGDNKTLGRTEKTEVEISFMRFIRDFFSKMLG